MQFIDLKTQFQHLEAPIRERMDRVLAHGQYILGPEVAELEQALAEYVGTSHCIAVSSGSDALLAALMALGIGAGDEVITSAFTFIATAEMIALLGARPVFVDIEADTYNLDPNLIEAAITPRTRWIILNSPSNPTCLVSAPRLTRSTRLPLPAVSPSSKTPRRASARRATANVPVVWPRWARRVFSRRNRSAATATAGRVSRTTRHSPRVWRACVFTVRASATITM